MNQVFFVQQEPRGPSELVEIPVTTDGANRVNIPDIQQLRSQRGQTIVIKAIRLIPPDILSRGIINDAANAPITELQKLVLVLYSMGWEKGHNIPLLTLNDSSNSQVGVPHVYNKTNFSDWQNVDWSKSYIQYGNGTGGSAGSPYVVILDVEYIKLNSEGQVIQTAQ